MSANKPIERYSVRTPETSDNSEWYVDATSFSEAAEVYVRSVLDGDISVDEDELRDAGIVEVRKMPELGDTPRLLDWDEVLEEIISVEDMISSFDDDLNEDWPEA